MLMLSMALLSAGPACALPMTAILQQERRNCSFAAAGRWGTSPLSHLSAEPWPQRVPSPFESGLCISTCARVPAAHLVEVRRGAGLRQAIVKLVH